jgi:hypothetical protein
LIEEVVLMISIPALAAGAATWSFAEYCIHRFAGHGPRRKKPKNPLAMVTPMGFAAAFNEEHVAHHVNPEYFAARWKKLTAAGIALPVLGSVASVVLGPRRGFSYALGFAGAYLAYEIIHRRVHDHPPASAYTRWVDKNHLHHHVNPKTNHGVTSPIWDHVFGTHEPVGRVKLHVRMAPRWMTDPASGALRPEFAEDYELTGIPRERSASSATAAAA